MPVRLQRGTYYGEPIAQREIAGLLLTEKRHRAGDRLPPHAHDHAYMCFVISGSWRERFDGGARVCSPRSVIFHPAGETHSDEFEEDAHLLAIELDSSWVRRIGGTPESLLSSSAFSDSHVSTTAIRLYHEARRDDAHTQLLVEGLMLELLGSCLRARAGTAVSLSPRWIHDAADLLRRDFQSPPALRELAVMAGVHPVHFARTFRTQLGCTVTEFVRKQRLDFVCRELIASRRAVALIALEAGFADQSHLTKAFQRSFGTTPARYRATAGQRSEVRAFDWKAKRSERADARSDL